MHRSVSYTKRLILIRCVSSPYTLYYWEMRSNLVEIYLVLHNSFGYLRLKIMAVYYILRYYT